MGLRIQRGWNQKGVGGIAEQSSVPSADEKFKALSDHYRDTFSLIHGYLKRRDRYFAASLGVSIVMLFQIAAPESSDRLIAVVIGRQVGVDLNDRAIVGTIVWLLLLAFAFRYFQLVVLVNRQYKYLQFVEDALSAEYDKVLFTREGRWYLDRYPAFSNWTHFLYRVAFPGLMLAVATAKVWSDTAQGWPGWGACCLSASLILNVVIYLVVAISILLYMRIFEFGRQLRLAAVTVWAVLARRHVDDVVRAEEKVVGQLDRTEVGTVTDSGLDKR